MPESDGTLRPTAIALSESGGYGLARLPDGCTVFFGAELDNLLLVLTPFAPGCEVHLRSHQCEVVVAFAECWKRAETRPMTAEEQGIWEQAVALVRPA